ncbi:MAG: LUD domain-containing protein [Lentisphaeria bacterium]|nr:LUD domain-containing protein [Lentisphaeria bacterium]NQZ67740.1 LUD domain-containing protein [Lentisphaeria bacterium]
MSAKSKILDKLRKVETRDISVPEITDRALFADYSRENLVDLFKEQLETIDGEFISLDSSDALKETIKEIASEEAVILEPGLPGDLSDDTQFTVCSVQTKNELAKFPFAVARASCLIARTGSAMVEHNKNDEFLLSVITDTLILIARKDQIVASIEEALADLEETSQYACIISGPSRTADIEKILVLGAHGPKRLIVIVY